MKKGGFYLLAALLFLSVPDSMAQETPMFQVKKLPVSSNIFNEISPVITPDGIIFCSDRKSKVFSDVTTFGGERVYDIFYSQQRDSVRWSNPDIWSQDISTVMQEGPFCFSPDGNTIYYTRSIETGKSVKRKKGRTTLGIFIASKSGDRWVNIKPFQYNDPSYNVAHPSVSPDGKYLFFASDMPGGEGGADLYYCEIKGEGFTKPTNVGKQINTPSSELYPNYHSSGRLYFSSDKPGGKGGLDIYYSFLQYGAWTKPIAVAEPLNSPADDFALVASSDGQKGYFTTNRDRTDDIYSFASTIIRRSNCPVAEVDSYCYEFIEENAIKLDSLPFLYEWDFGDGGKARGVTSEHCFEKPGDYLIKLNVVNLITGEIQYNEVTYLLEIRKIEQAVISVADKAKVGESIEMDASLTNLPGWNINKYYWSFDDGSAATGPTQQKIFSKAGNYNLQLIVTAARGGDGVVKETCVSKIIVIEE